MEDYGRFPTVVAANIVNQSSKEATVSDMQGAFVIDVREGDVLLFSAVNVMAREVIKTRV
jgi:hypothetical protein